MTGINDHPLQAFCGTCRFVGTDGDHGEILTCDIEYVSNTADEERDLIDSVDQWIQQGERGPCPGWMPSFYADQRSLDELDKYLNKR
jgi:hypothetical protein